MKLVFYRIYVILYGPIFGQTQIQIRYFQIHSPLAATCQKKNIIYQKSDIHNFCLFKKICGRFLKGK